MSLNGVISEELAKILANLKLEDVEAVIRAASLGLGPPQLLNGIQAVARGDDVPLPTGGGAPKPIVIQAWSFVRDRNQYHDTYGLTSAQAGDLMDLLRTDQDKGIAEITTIVSAHLRQRGSNKAVSVVTEGMPGSAPSSSQSGQVGKAGKGALKDEIRHDPSYYGLFQFQAQDTGRSGSERYRVRLGCALYATHPSKVGAIDVAKICRKHGRHYPLIADRICLWIAGGNPLYGDAIPEKVKFDGMLAPNDTIPADPVAKDKTVAQGN